MILLNSKKNIQRKERKDKDFCEDVFDIYLRRHRQIYKEREIARVDFLNYSNAIYYIIIITK